jgi:hypothetical protein
MAAIMHKIAHPDIPPSPRDKSVRTAHADGGSRDFEFKPHLNSSSQPLVHLPSIFFAICVYGNKCTSFCTTSKSTLSIVFLYDPTHTIWPFRIFNQ